MSKIPWSSAIAWLHSYEAEMHEAIKTKQTKKKSEQPIFHSKTYESTESAKRKVKAKQPKRSWSVTSMRLLSFCVFPWGCHVMLWWWASSLFLFLLLFGTMSRARRRRRTRSLCRLYPVETEIQLLAVKSAWTQQSAWDITNALKHTVNTCQ